MYRSSAILSVMLLAAVPVTATTPVTNLRYFIGQDYTRVVIDLAARADYNVGRVDEPGRIRIFFDIQNASVTKELATRNMAVDAGLLKQIRVGQYDLKTVRVVLDFTEETRVSSFLITNPYRLVIDVSGTGRGTGPPPIVQSAPAAPATEAAPTPAPPTPSPPPLPAPPLSIPAAPIPPPASNLDGKYSMARQLGLGVKLIVIDAGHGGTDPGCIGKTGVQEKNLTLDIAKRLKPMVEKGIGCNVLLTREDDRFIPLEERTAISNTSKADLFVSIHINSARNRASYGTETYFLNFATDQRAMEVAARENAMSSKNMGDLQSLVQKIALNSKIEESREFASIVQRNLYGRMTKHNSHPRNLGVKQAPFYVLIGAQMPAILVEVNFISNSSEEKLLKSSTYRAHVAEAILAGLKEYVATFNKPLPRSTVAGR